MMRSLALIPGVAALVVLGVGTGPAAAKQPSSGPVTASLTVNADPSFGGSVSLTATYGSMKQVPEISVDCTSNGQIVYFDVQMGSGTASPWVQQFNLWSQTWQAAGGGPANCVSQLFYYTWQGRVETGEVLLSSTSFVTT
jgi:hypothetical protein